MTRRARRLRAQLRRWLLDWLDRPDTTGSLECEPGCQEHAYCIAVTSALAGQYAVVLIGVDPPTGAPAIFTIWGRPGPEEHELLTHANQRIRGGFHALSAVGFHRHAVEAGELQ